MNSSHHQHSASAARPPQTSSLPESSNDNDAGMPAADEAVACYKNLAPSKAVPPSDLKKGEASPISDKPVETTSLHHNNIQDISQNPCSLMPLPPKKKRSLDVAVSTPVPVLATKLGSRNGVTDKQIPIPALTYERKTLHKKAPIVKGSKTANKKKRFSSILSGMMKTRRNKESKTDRETLRKNLGGGIFSKVDKI